MDDRAVHTLIHPIIVTTQVSGLSPVETRVTEVTVRRMNGGDKRWMGNNRADPNVDLGLLSRLTGLDAPTVDKLDIEDLTLLSDICEGFLPPSLKKTSGRTS